MNPPSVLRRFRNHTYSTVTQNYVSYCELGFRCYHAPAQFRYIRSAFIRTDLSASLSTTEWSTQLIPLGVVVYHGDPSSVAFSNTVINTLVETLGTRLDLGFHISGSRHRVNLLQYAKHTCIVANGPDSAQYFSDIVDRWLLWSGMKAKVSK